MAKTSASELKELQHERVKVVAVVGATVVLLAGVIACATISMAFLSNPPW